MNRERDNLSEAGRTGNSVATAISSSLGVVDVGSLDMDASSSKTVDCLLVLLSSSSCSVISISRLRRTELAEEEVDPDAVCKEQAADSVVSKRSLDEVMGKTASCGENFSLTALK